MQMPFKLLSTGGRIFHRERSEKGEEWLWINIWRNSFVIEKVTFHNVESALASMLTQRHLMESSWALGVEMGRKEEEREEFDHRWRIKRCTVLDIRANMKQERSKVDCWMEFNNAKSNLKLLRLQTSWSSLSLLTAWEHFGWKQSVVVGRCRS